jgi:hypothetical protein
LRPRNARYGRQRGSARGQMQKLPSVGKLHGALQEAVLRHQPISRLHPSRGPLSLDIESAPGTTRNLSRALANGSYHRKKQTLAGPRRAPRFRRRWARRESGLLQPPQQAAGPPLGGSDKAGDWAAFLVSPGCDEQERTNNGCMGKQNQLEPMRFRVDPGRYSIHSSFTPRFRLSIPFPRGRVLQRRVPNARESAELFCGIAARVRKPAQGLISTAVVEPFPLVDHFGARPCVPLACEGRRMREDPPEDCLFPPGGLALREHCRPARAGGV